MNGSDCYYLVDEDIVACNCLWLHGGERCEKTSGGLREIVQNLTRCKKLIRKLTRRKEFNSKSDKTKQFQFIILHDDKNLIQNHAFYKNSFILNQAF